MLALVPKSLHDRDERWLLLVVGFDPAEAHAERHQIGAHGRLGLRPNPPCRSIVAAVPLGIGGREHRLADAAQPVQSRDRRATLVPLQRPFDRGKRLLAAHEVGRNADRDVGTATTLPGKVTALVERAWP